jgi:hypothetical protein
MIGRDRNNRNYNRIYGINQDFKQDKIYSNLFCFFNYQTKRAGIGNLSM